MILGFDTSNYTTSLAVLDDSGNPVLDERILLTVQKGNRGLRQSEAVSQHRTNLPILFQKCFEIALSVPDPFGESLIWTKEEQEMVRSACQSIEAIGVSSRPRSVEGSYMPCFLAGMRFAEMLSGCLEVPLYVFSHQEGHMQAATRHTSLEAKQDYLAWHLSGGTCELLEWHWLSERNHEALSSETVLGGSLDISFGQVLDRMGVKMSIPFPCGKEIDTLALQTSVSSENPLSPIRVVHSEFNLSGLETQILREMERIDAVSLSYFVMKRIYETIEKATLEASYATGMKQVLFAGGVSSSRFLRENLMKSDSMRTLDVVFGEPKYATDNAVGIALLAAREQKRGKQ